MPPRDGINKNCYQPWQYRRRISPAKQLDEPKGEEGVEEGGRSIGNKNTTEEELKKYIYRNGTNGGIKKLWYEEKINNGKLIIEIVLN